MRRKPSRSTPEEPPMCFPSERCGLILTITSRAGCCGRPWPGRARPPQPHDLIGHHVGRAIRLRQRALFDDLEHTVVAQAADLVRPVFDDGVEQRELRAAAVLDVQPADSIVRSRTARSSCSPPPFGVTSIRNGTCRLTSKCVCNRHLTIPAPDCRHMTDAAMIRGIATINAASTRVIACSTYFSRESFISGG